MGVSSYERPLISKRQTDFDIRYDSSQLQTWTILVMDRYTNEQRVKVVEAYYKNRGSKKNTFHALHGKPGPTFIYLLGLISKTAASEDMKILERLLNNLSNIWCRFWSEEVIGPYFFEDEAGNTVTTDSVSYCNMMTNFFFNRLDLLDEEELWFQQDGATPHRTGAVFNLLRQRFDNRIFAYGTGIKLPPRSCDLFPLDFFLWGYLKSKVYRDRPQTLEDLKIAVRREIALMNQTNKMHDHYEYYVVSLDFISTSHEETLIESPFITGDRNLKEEVKSQKQRLQQYNMEK